eukprot:m.128881 g.128881  ORF g.128881 m.128881 type:complete len:74 (+) comp9457_c1_seq1:2660-2881(+)
MFARMVTESPPLLESGETIWMVKFNKNLRHKFLAMPTRKNDVVRASMNILVSIHPNKTQSGSWESKGDGCRIA